MATLAKRATQRQAHVLKIIDGAARNAFDAHPDAEIGPRLARSIAKRAAGTLIAAWPSVLARSQGGSDCEDGHCNPGPANHGSQLVTCHDGPIAARLAGVTSKLTRRDPIPELVGAISALVGPAKRAGNTERADTLIEVLRMIAARHEIQEMRAAYLLEIKLRKAAKRKMRRARRRL